MIYIFWTCRDVPEAKRIIRALLDQRLIACATLFAEVESLYRWEGQIEESREVKAILKTSAPHFDKIKKYIISHCSYQVPEIVQVSIVQGNASYLSWILQETIWAFIVVFIINNDFLFKLNITLIIIYIDCKINIKI